MESPATPAPALFDDGARAAAVSVAAAAGKLGTRDAALLAIHAVLHRNRFSSDEAAYTFYKVSKQRF